MHQNTKLKWLLLCLSALLILPLAGAWVYFKFSHPLALPPAPTAAEIAAGIDPIYKSPLPTNFFEFPPTSDQSAFIQEMRKGSGAFNPWIFSILLAFFGLVLSVYAFPKLFGFKASIPEPTPPKSPLPSWFYVGSLLFAIPTQTTSCLIKHSYY